MSVSSAVRILPIVTSFSVLLVFMNQFLLNSDKRGLFDQGLRVIDQREESNPCKKHSMEGKY